MYPETKVFKVINYIYEQEGHFPQWIRDHMHIHKQEWTPDDKDKPNILYDVYLPDGRHCCVSKDWLHDPDRGGWVYSCGICPEIPPFKYLYAEDLLDVLYDTMPIKFLEKIKQEIN